MFENEYIVTPCDTALSVVLEALNNLNATATEFVFRTNGSREVLNSLKTGYGALGDGYFETAEWKNMLQRDGVVHSLGSFLKHLVGEAWTCVSSAHAAPDDMNSATPHEFLALVHVSTKLTEVFCLLRDVVSNVDVTKMASESLSTVWTPVFFPHDTAAITSLTSGDKLTSAETITAMQQLAEQSKRHATLIVHAIENVRPAMPSTIVATARAPAGEAFPSESKEEQDTSACTSGPFVVEAAVDDNEPPPYPASAPNTTRRGSMSFHFTHPHASGPPPPYATKPVAAHPDESPSTITMSPQATTPSNSQLSPSASFSGRLARPRINGVYDATSPPQSHASPPSSSTCLVSPPGAEPQIINNKIVLPQMPPLMALFGSVQPRNHSPVYVVRDQRTPWTPKSPWRPGGGHQGTVPTTSVMYPGSRQRPRSAPKR